MRTDRTRARNALLLLALFALAGVQAMGVSSAYRVCEMTSRPPACVGPESLCRGVCVPICPSFETCGDAVLNLVEDIAELVPCGPLPASSPAANTVAPSCPPYGHQPNPGQEQCIWGTSGWCFQPDDVGTVQGNGSQPWCVPGKEAVRAASTFTARFRNPGYYAPSGDSFNAQWELRNPQGVLLAAGSVTFYRVTSIQSPPTFQTLASIPASAGTPNDCDDLILTAGAPCGFHCSGKWLRYL